MKKSSKPSLDKVWRSTLKSRQKSNPSVFLLFHRSFRCHNISELRWDFQHLPVILFFVSGWDTIIADVPFSLNEERWFSQEWINSKKSQWLCNYSSVWRRIFNSTHKSEMTIKERWVKLSSRCWWFAIAFEPFWMFTPQWRGLAEDPREKVNEIKSDDFPIAFEPFWMFIPNVTRAKARQWSTNFHFHAQKFN